MNELMVGSFQILSVYISSKVILKVYKDYKRAHQTVARFDGFTVATGQHCFDQRSRSWMVLLHCRLSRIAFL